MLKHALLGLLAAQTALSSRFVMYIDQYVAIFLSRDSRPPLRGTMQNGTNSTRYHIKGLPSGGDLTKGITHAVMAFAKSDLFNSNSTPEYNPFESVKEMRARFEPDTKVLVALGGWGDTEGFGEGSKDDESRERYAKNVAAVVKDGGFDGVGMSPYHLCYDTGEDKELRRIRHRLGISRRQR